jgi:2-polyprenyl-3-methyl-5-hydroxy-6-metoxy-1,4-benzoquinol methylase
MRFNWSEIQYREDGKILVLPRHERIFEEGLVKPKMKILDVGGWGILASRLLQEGTDCTILDLFTEDQQYPERVKSLPFIYGDILDTNLIRSFPKYDLITCFEVLEHVKDVELAINNMHTLLVTDGWLVGTIPIPGMCHAVNDPTVNFINVKKMKAMMKKVGFKKILVEETPSLDGTICSWYFKGQKV